MAFEDDTENQVGIERSTWKSGIALRIPLIVLNPPAMT